MVALSGRYDSHWEIIQIAFCWYIRVQGNQ